MQVALMLALWLTGAPPADADAPAAADRDPAPPQLPALELPAIENVDNPLVPPPPPPRERASKRAEAGRSDEADRGDGQDGKTRADDGDPKGDGGELRPVALPTRADGTVGPAHRRSRRADRAAMARLRLIDLRDPFERRGRPGGVNRTLTARFILPDLKDPFAINRRPRPKNWSAPELPVDIRDPFSERAVAHHRPGCAPIRTKTPEGVAIQRPASARKEAEREERDRRERCEQLEQRDLRDPFNSR